VTWHHVAALMLAVVMVVAAAHSALIAGNPGAFSSVMQLATGIVVGAFGHAGTRGVFNAKTKIGDSGDFHPDKTPPR
jgi:hypothetical protein